ncbi:hypothetical protein ACIQ9R_36500 [Streptomyces sp. NPDC094447]|uniref:hypothetical protein n=1 Tax=Streptomyces sp. NPDC094447 TaxID=3366062 RepID=UPI00382D1C21
MRVTGTFEDGAAYEVEITGRSDRPVIGSRRIAALVEQRTGTPMVMAMLGPIRGLDPADEEAVLALLRQETYVVEAEPRRT